MNCSISIVEKSGIRHYVDLFHAKVVVVDDNTIIVDYGYGKIYTVNDVINIDEIEKTIKRSMKRQAWFL
jgi:hypothetical protein